MPGCRSTDYTIFHIYCLLSDSNQVNQDNQLPSLQTQHCYSLK